MTKKLKRTYELSPDEYTNRHRMWNEKLDFDSFEKERELFYNRPEWVKKKELRDINFIRKIILKIFILWIRIRSKRVSRKFREIEHTMKKIDRDFVVISKKILYSKNIEKE